MFWIRQVLILTYPYILYYSEADDTVFYFTFKDIRNSFSYILPLCDMKLHHRITTTILVEEFSIIYMIVSFASQQLTKKQIKFLYQIKIKQVFLSEILLDIIEGLSIFVIPVRKQKSFFSVQQIFLLNCSTFESLPR